MAHPRTALPPPAQPAIAADAFGAHKATDVMANATASGKQPPPVNIGLPIRRTC
jgi:hypothetical protein